MKSKEIEIDDSESRKDKRKNITLFMIIVFSLLLGASAGIEPILTRILIQIILFVGQLVIVKSLLDDVYS